MRRRKAREPTPRVTASRPSAVDTAFEQRLPLCSLRKKVQIADARPLGADPARVIAELCRRFPAAFALDPWQACPLKVGIRKDIDHALADAIPRDDLSIGLAAYLTSNGYLAGLVENEPRIDLDGNDVDVVTARQAEVAAVTLASRRRRGLLTDEAARP